MNIFRKLIIILIIIISLILTSNVLIINTLSKNVEQRIQYNLDQNLIKCKEDFLFFISSAGNLSKILADNINIQQYVTIGDNAGLLSFSENIIPMGFNFIIFTDMQKIVLANACNYEDIGRKFEVPDLENNGEFIGDVEGQTSLISYRLVEYEREKVGYVFTGYFLNNQFAERLKDRCNTEIIVYADGLLKAKSWAADSLEEYDRKKFRSKTLDSLEIEIYKDNSNIREDIKKVRAYSILAIIVIMIVSISSLLFIVKKYFLNVLSQIVNHLKKVSRGDFTSKVEIVSKDELGQLSVVANRMADDLRKQQEELINKNKELKNAHKRLIQSEKLAATGKLAAGIAHEINNPLQGITSSLKIVKDTLGDDFQEKRSIELVEEGIARIGNIVRQLLDLHRPEYQDRMTTDINKIIKQVISLMRSQLQKGKIKIDEALSPDLPKIKASAQQLHQVFLNIILNAHESMKNGGELKISTEKVDGNISIEITDNGEGISEEDVPYIFDPFFSTGKSGGSGLGLSITYEVIRAHHGDIRVKSEVGTGTTFTIILPIG